MSFLTARGKAPMLHHGKRLLWSALLLCCCPVTTTAQDAVIGRSFPGTQQFNFDADAAVGPDHYAQITNAEFRVTSLDGTEVYRASPLRQFWSEKVGLPLLTRCCFDPQLKFDHATKRWFALSLGGSNGSDSSLYLAISSTSDPTGAWKGVLFDSDPSDLRYADYPKLGFDGAALYIRVNLIGISSATPARVALFSLPKNDLTGDVPTAARLSRFISSSASTPTEPRAAVVVDYMGTATEGFTLRYDAPVDPGSSSPNTWSVRAEFQRMSGQTTATAAMLPWATSAFQFVSAQNPPPSAFPTDWARQPGTTIRLDNGGDMKNVRVGDIVYSVTSAAVRGRYGIFWARFRASTNNLIDAGFIGDDVNDFISPAIAANSVGEVIVAYGRSSPVEFGSFYYSAGRPDASGKLTFRSPVLVRAGSEIYDVTGLARSSGVARYVDYASSVSVHPSDPSRFWISGPFVAGRNLGSTWISEVIIRDSGNAVSPGALRFASLPPCRVMETRAEYNFEGRTGPFGPPYLRAGETRSLTLANSGVCQIPANAKAVVLNITLIPRAGVDFATLWPAGETRPNFWSIRSPDGQIVANQAIVKSGNGAIQLYVSHDADMLIDVSGYFADPLPAVPNLVYYPLTPCRVIETRIDYRNPAGPFGPPTMNKGQTRRFQFPSSPHCSIPSGATAYSATLTVVPPQPLPFMTLWPAGGSQPNVSSINSFAGRILANNIIVPASADGSIDVFAFDRTDFIVDINGYFAPDNGLGLYYFPVTQCRANDSTLTGAYPDDTARSINVPTAGNCSGIPPAAKGYVVNVTAIPGGSPMPFITIYPTGQPRPNASILNAFEGQTVTNSTIVPAGPNGAIDIYAFRHTQVVVDISGYFGR